jgi:O-methyltransferase
MRENSGTPPAPPDAVDTYLKIFERFNEFTMIPERLYSENLQLCKERAPSTGCIVECGVWRGGMSAGIAEILPGRTHYLFDSFEGLPPAKEIDGEAATKWQEDTDSPRYFNNCKAERSCAEQIMKMSAANQFHLIQGWFSDTMLNFVPREPIAILRLDGDWYESTIQALISLYPHVMVGGLVIVDDYYTWDGCSRAVHDYFSACKLADRIERTQHGVCYFVKRKCNYSKRQHKLKILRFRTYIKALSRSFGLLKDARNSQTAS